MADEDDDALFDNLEKEAEDDPTIAHLREARIQQLSSDLARAKSLRGEGYGTYLDIKDEKLLLEITTSHQRCIVHFHKTDFNRCRIMDEHLKMLAEEHLEARFVKINVENAPFLVTKLNVKVLPCVIAFIDGVSVDRIVGFEGLGYGEDTFKTSDLERRLADVGALDKVGVTGVLGSSRRGTTENDEAQKRGEEDSGDEWD